MGVFAAILLSAIALGYVFWPHRSIPRGFRKTRLDYLRERRDVIYDNLRDLNFEYRAGKHPEADFLQQREALENEAANILAESDVLEALHSNAETRLGSPRT